MYFIGYDIGSTSVKASLIEAESGHTAASDHFPKQEMAIRTPHPGHAEQNPEDWWANLKTVTASVLEKSGVKKDKVAAIGIAYQMHGLVAVDKDQQIVRPSIIWCDSRAVPYGQRAFEAIGKNRCLTHLLNSPGNFTASKLAWVKENEPKVFSRIDKIMLPGDYIAMRMSGQATTTVSGLSEGIFWDFEQNTISKDVLEYFGFDQKILPGVVPTFGIQGELTAQAAAELGLNKGTPLTYRAGDQPNNALSLNVLQGGEIAATAGTSGVVYGVNDKVNYDPLSRVNTFAHVNHTAQNPRLGVLLCINGTGILNSWVKNNIFCGNISYPQMNEMAAGIPSGSQGLYILPFGNGSERMLGSRNIGASIHGLDLNIHTQAHIARSAQEGIVYSFFYGMGIMQQMGMDISVIRAGAANMFLSPVFHQALADLSGAVIELYGTDGAAGAARGAGIGLGFYKSTQEAFSTLHKIETVSPDPALKQTYTEHYGKWLGLLEKQLND